MNPELKDCEHSVPDEENLITEVVRLVGERMAVRPPQEGAVSVPRGQHAKATGCVRATFTVRDNLTDEYRHGVFRQGGKRYEAIVRFSNALETIEPDGKGSARGIAIKLLDVDGTRAIRDSSD